jgi:hypothetical protein
MKKSAMLNFCTVWFILASALVPLPAPAQAYVYDDFNGTGIDYTNRWVDSIPEADLFSQPGDGSLHFSDPSPGGQSDRLRSKNPVGGAFFVALEYSGFQAGNMQPGGELRSTALNLFLGYGSASETNMVFIGEAKNSTGQFIQALRKLGEDTSYLSAPYYNDYNSGWLGISYNGILGPGGEVVLSYDFGTGWTVLASIDPNFSQAPYFYLAGTDLYGTSLSFQVQQVQLNHIPLPPSVLLLGSGLLGLLALGRRPKRS